MFGERGRIGIVVPANNATLEPELWSRLPAGAALYCTRILAKGDLTPQAVHAMETHFDRAVEELIATIVDVIVYADMVTTFIMDPDWNRRRTAAVEARTGVPCISAWMAMDAALKALGIRRFALGTPYPRAVHALCMPFFESLGYALTGDDTLDILAMTDVPKVDRRELGRMAGALPKAGAEAVVLLATDLPTFEAIAELEAETGLPVLTSNQTILWHALRRCGNRTPVAGLGKLLAER
jgi:maleate isomerase